MTVIGAWVTLMCLASESPERGYLYVAKGVPLTEYDISLELDGLDLQECDTLLDAFFELGLLCLEDEVIKVSKFNDRQYVTNSSTKRVQRFRKRQEKQDETFPNVVGNVSETLHETLHETAQPRFSNVPASVSVSVSDSEGKGSARGRGKVPAPIMAAFRDRGYMPTKSGFEAKWEKPVVDWLARAEGDVPRVVKLVNEAIDLAVTKGYTVAAPSSLSTIMANLMAGKNSRGQTRAALEGWNEVKAAWRHRTPEDQLPADVQSVIKLMGGLAAVGQMREVEAKQQFTTLWGTS